MTEDEQDLKLLGMANENRKFALQLGYPDPDVNAALWRAINGDWVSFVDLGPVEGHGASLFRFFKLTDAGMRRLAEVKKADG